MNQTYTILAVVILGLVLELIYAYKLKSDKKIIDKLSKKYEAEFEKTKQQLEKIVTATRNESQEVVSITLDQYKKVHSQVADLTKNIPIKIESDISEQTKIYQEKLTHNAIESTKLLNTKIQEEIQILSKKLAEEISSVQKKTVADLLSETNAAKEEITKFKQEQMNALALKSEKLADEITKKYLGKALSADDKHEATLKIIDEIWQEGTSSDQ